MNKLTTHSKSPVITIRRATINDLNDILSLTRKLWDYHVPFDPLWRTGQQMRKHDQQWYRTKLRSKNFRVYVAERRGKIIGFFSGQIRPSGKALRYKYQGFINQAYLKPDYQGLGIGKQLLNECIAWFKSRKLDFVELHVDSRNIQGHQAWAKMGFKEYIKRMRRKI